MIQSPAGSLGGRLSRWLALQSLLVLAAICGAVYWATAVSFQSRQSEALLEKEALVRHLLSEAAAGLDVEAVRHKLDDLLVGQRDLSLRLEGPDGTIFYAKSPASPNTTGQREFRFMTPMPAVGPTGLSATLTLDIGEDRRLLRRVGLTLVAAALAGAALISAGGNALVRVGLRPVRDLVAQTRLLAANTLDRRLDGSAQPEELQPLIAQFNDLLTRLERAYEQVEGFNADVAHEMCTPLATLVGTTEVALRRARGVDELRGVLESNLEDLQRIASIVQDMLFLSQADRGSLARRTPVESLCGVATRIAEYHEAALADAELSVRVVGEAQGDFDAPLLERALSNLMANATRYADRESEIDIEIGHVGSQVRLTVANRGAPIDPAHLPRLFQRFYRADGSRSNSARNHGLGLSIVAAIARMHGGTTFAKCDGNRTSIGLLLPVTSPENRSMRASDSELTGARFIARRLGRQSRARPV